MRVTRAMAGRRVKVRLVWLAGSDGIGHRIVAFKDQPLGAEFAEILRLLLASPERIEGLHHVLDFSSFQAVQMKVRGVEFGSDQSSAFLVPPEGWSIISQILCEWLHVAGSIRDFENSALNPMTSLVERPKALDC